MSTNPTTLRSPPWTANRNRALLATTIALTLGLGAPVGAIELAGGRPAGSGAFHPWHSRLRGALALTERPGAARARIAAARPAADRPAATLEVTSCADDGTPGTLRAVVASAVSGDFIDMRQLQCSSITLTSGQINVYVDDLALQGPGRDALTIDGNHADRVIADHGGYGGAEGGRLGFYDLTIANGVSTAPDTPYGGCIYSYASDPVRQIFLSNTTVSGCTASSGSAAYGAGGGIFTHGSLILFYSTIADNRAIGDSVAQAGGAQVEGDVALYYSTVSGNFAGSEAPGTARYPYSGAGGLLSLGNVSIAHSTISGNQTDGHAGGAFFSVAYYVSVRVIDSTISDNVSGGDVGGMEVSSDGTATLTVSNSTIAFNTSGGACGGVGAVYGTALRTIDLQSSIIADNVADSGDSDLCNFGAVTGANNLVGASTVALPDDTIFADPLLGPLQDNGGPTFTHALRPGSPAIDHGNNVAAFATDQRGNGFPRVVGAAADIGAFEVGTVTNSFDANQFALTGSWYNPATSGQGLELAVYPDANSAGEGVLFGGWYAFDDAGNEQWFTLQGTLSSSHGSSYALGIYVNTGGNFNAPPVTTATPDGSATLTFHDCTNAALTYTFNDGRTGTIPYVRLSNPTGCSSAVPATAPMPLPANYNDVLHSGAWYDPATSGQGINVDIIPSQTTFFAAWYTYAPVSAGQVGLAGQRWFTLQTNDYTPGDLALTNVPIYASTGGIFNTPSAVTTTQVGTANVTFTSCTTMTLNYTFTSGEFARLTGSIDEQNPIPAAGCQDGTNH